MQLVINSYGAYLHKSGNLFVIKTEEKSVEVSADKVDSILISTSAILSTDALVLAIENNIDVVFLDKFGNPMGRVWHSRLGSTSVIRRCQLEADKTSEGFKLAKGFIVRKIENQISFLKDLKKNRMELCGEFDAILERMSVSLEELKKLKGTADKMRGSVMGIEGVAAKYYFEGLCLCLPEKWKFCGRSRNPAKDGFNALLNYGYGVLYSQVERGCIIAGLDPYIGILHTDNYNKMSFVFDLIEVFRIYVDRVVMNLFAKRKVKESFFDEVPGGVMLNKEGKGVLITALNEMFESKVKVGRRVVSVRSSIPLECHSIANKMLGRGE